MIKGKLFLINKNMDDHIINAVKILKEGGIVIFPTDTAFGIGCRMDDEEAVKRLFALRKRPETQAAPVLISSLKMAEKYLKKVPDEVIENLIQLYWPGALTIILQSNTETVHPLVHGGTATLGVRVPDHLTTLALLNGVGVPILGPSANFHGGKTPYIFEDLDEGLTKLVDYIVPGTCHIKEASTVVDCTVSPWKVVRQGAVKLAL
jgi:L-threonylcarbamoyladenylate synthase